MNITEALLTLRLLRPQQPMPPTLTLVLKDVKAAYRKRALETHPDKRAKSQAKGNKAATNIWEPKIAQCKYATNDEFLKVQLAKAFLCDLFPDGETQTTIKLQAGFGAKQNKEKTQHP